MAILASLPNFAFRPSRNLWFCGVSMLVRYEADMYMPTAVSPMVLAVPSSIARLP
ncbi:hypothetical protein D3C77_765880 [compost metagenome]